MGLTWALVLLRRICCSVSSLQVSVSSISSLFWSGHLCGLQGIASFNRVLPLHGFLSVPVPRAPSPSSSSLTLEFTVFFLTFFSFTPHCLGNVLPFLNYAFTEAAPASLVNSAVSCSGYTAEQPDCFLLTPFLQPSPGPKPCHQHPV